MDDNSKSDQPAEPQLHVEPSDVQPPASQAAQGVGEVQHAIEQDCRVMIAALKLPEKGAIREELKRQVCQRVQTLRTHRNVSLRALAKQLGGKSHEAIISQVLRRKYDHADDDIIRRLNAWVEATSRRIASLRPIGIVDTAVVTAVKAGCDYAKAQGTMVLLIGPSGVGKSVAARVYCSEDLNALYIRLQSTHTRPTAFLRQLAEACNVAVDRGRARIMDTVIQKLRGSHRLLLLDEWHQAERPLYEAVRDLHDVAEIPMVLIGTEAVQKRVVETRVRKGAVWSDQFCSRIGWVRDLTRLKDEQGEPRPLFTMQEIREIFRAGEIRISRDGAEFLQALACSVGLGCLRIAERCFAMGVKLARRRGGVVTARELRQAFVQQAVPDGMDDSALLVRVEESGRRIRALVAG